MSLRTVWLTNDFPPRSGGIEQFVGNLVRRLAPGSARVLTSSWPGSDAHDAAIPQRVDRIGRRPLLPTPAVRDRLHRTVVEHRAQAVVFGASWPLAELAVGLPVPALALSHGHEAGMVRVGGGPLVRRATRGLGALGYISDFTRDALAPWVADGCRLVRLPPGVDAEVFSPAADGGGVRTALGIEADAPVVVCLSRLVARKGQDVLVEAWPAVAAAHPRARLLLVGTGPLEPRLRARVEALGLAGRVLLVGEVPWEDLARYHAAADLFAMPCRTRLGGLDVEGLGIVYLEAQACGVPVLAGRSGGAPSALADGRTGLVVDGRSAVEVSDALLDLLADRQRLRRMGAAGRRFVAERYAWPHVVEVLEGALEALVAGHAGVVPGEGDR